MKRPRAACLSAAQTSLHSGKKLAGELEEQNGDEEDKPEHQEAVSLALFFSVAALGSHGKGPGFP